MKQNISISLPGWEDFVVTDTQEVYTAVLGYFFWTQMKSLDLSIVSEENHLIAADAEGWCELASIGEEYTDSRMPGLRLEILE